MNNKCVVSISDKDSKYALTFQATGCPNRTMLHWWKTQTDNRVFGDMFAYCTLVRDGKQTVQQKRQCCGEGNDCKPSKCLRQSLWTTGIENIITLTLRYVIRIIQSKQKY